VHCVFVPALGVGTKEEDDSVSGSSCKSSPSASPYPSHRKLLSDSTNSMSDLLAAAAEDSKCRQGVRDSEYRLIVYRIIAYQVRCKCWKGLMDVS
jgi:hypothetical protein